MLTISHPPSWLADLPVGERVIRREGGDTEVEVGSWAAGGGTLQSAGGENFDKKTC